MHSLDIRERNELWKSILQSFRPVKMQRKNKKFPLSIMKMEGWKDKLSVQGSIGNIPIQIKILVH